MPPVHCSVCNQTVTGCQQGFTGTKFAWALCTVCAPSSPHPSPFPHGEIRRRSTCSGRGASESGTKQARKEAAFAIEGKRTNERTNERVRGGDKAVLRRVRRRRRRLWLRGWLAGWLAAEPE